MKKAVIAFLAAAFLSGCGGGGSSSGSADVGNLYTGKTTQAVVDASNAKAVSSDALRNIQKSAEVSPTTVFKSAAESTESPFRVQPVVGILKNGVLAIASKPAVAKAVASTDSGTKYGFSGSYDYSGTKNDTNGAVSGTITFNSFAEYSGAPTISGTMRVNGTVDTVTGDLKNATATLNNISVTANSSSLTMNGSISIVVTADKETIAATIVTLDNSSRKTSYMKNLALELTSGTSLTISGTFYSNDYGYVVISTTTPLATSGFDNSVYTGELLFTGANGTKAKVVFPGPAVSWYNGTSFVLVP